MKGHDIIAKGLGREGVDYLFCFPTMPMIQSARREGIQPIICRQERVGVNMADGFSRATNGTEIGVFASQYGPGAENAFPGVATAYADSSPVLYLAFGYETDRAGVAPYFSTVESFDPITKWAEYVNEAAHGPDVLRRAFTYLRSGRPGPVALELPADVLAEEAEPALHRGVDERSRSAGDPDNIERAMEVLLEADNPVIHAGQGVLYAEATTELVDLAELLQIPVMTTLAGKSAFPENHDLSLGTGARTTSGPVRHFLPEADVVFGIGCSFTRHVMATEIPERRTLIHATNDPIDINKMYDVEHPVVGDAKLVLQQMIDEAKQQLSEFPRRTDVAQRIAAVRDEWLEEWRPKLRSDETPITPFRIIWDFMNTVDPRDAIVTHDSGSPRDQLTPFYRATEPRSYIGWGKSHSLGTGLGLIMGAKLARPEKMCVNFMGDAAFGMVGLDFETAIRNEIPIVTVVLNNNSMAAYEERLGDARFLNGNYADLARSLGGHAERVTEPGNISDAFERAREYTESESQPMLLEFITNEETAQNELIGL